MTRRNLGLTLTLFGLVTSLAMAPTATRAAHHPTSTDEARAIAALHAVKTDLEPVALASQHVTSTDEARALAGAARGMQAYGSQHPWRAPITSTDEARAALATGCSELLAAAALPGASSACARQ